MSYGLSMAIKLPWRQATTLILARNGEKYPRQLQEMDKRQVEILYVKRSRKSSDVFSSHYAFPGGTVDSADFSNMWLRVYERISERLGKGCVKQFLDSSIQFDKNIQLYKEGDKLVNGIPPHVAFRICAIRETFEETGILLCIDADKLNKEGRGFYQLFKTGDFSKWRESVHNDAHKFIELCNEFNCVPDVWSLLEWSNWLTPPILSKRWDTLFYICCLREGLAAYPDKVEISSLEWLRSCEAIQRGCKGDIILPVPTMYESSRLNRFYHLDMLERFAIWRAEHHPCSRINPAIIVKGTDIFISVYKSDSIYEELIEKGFTHQEDITLHDLKTKPGLFHRFVRIGENSLSIFCNAVPMDGHLIPSLLSSDQITSKL